MDDILFEWSPQQAMQLPAISPAGLEDRMTVVLKWDEVLVDGGDTKLVAERRCVLYPGDFGWYRLNA